MKENLYTVKFTDKSHPDIVKFLGRSKVKSPSYLRDSYDTWKDLMDIPMIDEPVGIYYKEENCKKIISDINWIFNNKGVYFPYNAELYVCESLNDKIRNRLTPVSEVQALIKEYNKTKNPELLEHLLDHGEELLQNSVDELLKL